MRTEEVCWQKTLSISAPSVPAEQLSTSVLAEQLSVIEFGVKKLHVVQEHAMGASPGAPVHGSYATAIPAYLAR